MTYLAAHLPVMDCLDSRFISEQAAWENVIMSRKSIKSFPLQLKVGLIIAMVSVLAVATWLTPVHFFVLHNILHHLNILPLMLAGMLFGWRGALQALVLATVLQAPSIYRHWHHMPLDAQDQLVELSTFGTASLIAGVVADRERTQRRRVEMTKAELERVYTELRENIQQMKKTERLTAAGQLSASLAHEIRNPLASISGAAGILARGQAPAESREECLDILTKESLRLNKLLTNFLDFARPRLPRFLWTDPLSIIQSVIALTQHLAARQSVTLIQESEPALREIECDPEQIKQVLLNLILNAIQASKKNAVVQVSSRETQDHLRIEVLDRGIGIAPEDLERMFDPFYTTKETGTGLGLSIAANIVTQHGGFITCVSQTEGQGMIFRVDLPFVRQLSAPSVKLPQKAMFHG